MLSSLYMDSSIQSPIWISSLQSRRKHQLIFILWCRCWYTQIDGSLSRNYNWSLFARKSIKNWFELWWGIFFQEDLVERDILIIALLTPFKFAFEDKTTETIPVEPLSWPCNLKFSLPPKQITTRLLTLAEQSLQHPMTSIATSQSCSQILSSWYWSIFFLCSYICYLGIRTLKSTLLAVRTF